jgi:hypothetical protein
MRLKDGCMQSCVRQLTHTARTSALLSTQRTTLRIVFPHLQTLSRHFSQMPTVNTFTNNVAPTTARLEHVRKYMKSINIDIYSDKPPLSPLTLVIPSEDAHQSEYVCAADKRREFITGIAPPLKVCLSRY